VEAEIMQVVVDEAKESYANERVVVLQSDSLEQMEENIGRALAWAKSEIARRASEPTPSTSSTASSSSAPSKKGSSKKKPVAAAAAATEDAGDMDGEED
jgi:hypothetical protein